MRNLRSCASLLCCMAAMFLASCGETTPPDDKPSNVVDTLPKARWNNPGRGKIFDKTNVVQIPLTAYENHIFGPVKSVTYTSYTVAEGSRALEDSGYNVYDKAGHLVDQNEYDNKGKAKWNCIYRYDDQGRPVEWDFKFADAERNSKTTFKCDDKGRKTEQNEAVVNKEDSRRLVFKYDDKGNEVEVEEYSGSNIKPWSSTYKYDSRGNQVEYVHKDEAGRVLVKRTQEYDSRGNAIAGIIYTSDTTIKAKWTATYDNKGRRIADEFYRKDGAMQVQSKMKYDDWDNVVEFLIYKADGSIDRSKPSFYTEYEYDGKGNPVKETWYSLEGDKKVMTEVVEKKYSYHE